MTVPDEVIERGIASDADYVGRLMRDLLAHDGEGDFLSALSFCLAPYLSLIVHESVHKLQRLDPAAPALLSPEAVVISARSRHSLKLFEDTKRGIDGQLQYFRDEILSSHSERFLNNTWLWLARRFETDLGLYCYDGKLITTTHAATFHLGVEPKKLITKGAGPYIRAAFQEYGTYFGKLGARLDSSGDDTFIKHLSAAKMDKPTDVRSSHYYDRAFNGKDTPDINGVATGFQAMMNFANTVATAGSATQELEYTAFKIRYLCLYTVLASLRQLHADARYSLTAESNAILLDILTSPEALIVTDAASRPFRNTLMHYNLSAHVDISRVDVTQPLFGLVRIYFPSYDTVAFAELVDRCIMTTADRLNGWAAASRQDAQSRNL